jgi:hypothetical protein
MNKKDKKPTLYIDSISPYAEWHAIKFTNELTESILNFAIENNIDPKDVILKIEEDWGGCWYESDRPQIRMVLTVR